MSSEPQPAVPAFASLRQVRGRSGALGAMNTLLLEQQLRSIESLDDAGLKKLQGLTSELLPSSYPPELYRALFGVFEYQRKSGRGRERMQTHMPIGAPVSESSEVEIDGKELSRCTTALSWAICPNTYADFFRRRRWVFRSTLINPNFGA